MTWDETKAAIEAEFTCLHPDRKLVHVMATNGTKMFTRQCQKCGKVGDNLGVWVSTAKIPPHDRAAAPARNDALADEWQKARSDRWREASRGHAQSQQDRYRTGEYHRTPHWQKRRWECLKAADNRCQAKMRGCAGRATDVHHLTYFNMGDEPLWDLRAVCRNCHDRLELKKRGEIDFCAEIGYEAAA